jgi:hypothetical protein
MKKRIIKTSNKEIYEKFSMLHFLSEITLKNVEKFQVERIIRNINGDSRILDMELVGDYIIIRKINPFKFDIYYKGG